MLKKTIILSVSILVLVIVSTGAFWAYQQGYLFKKKDVLTPAKLLASFNVQNHNLTAEQIKLFQQRFNEKKAELEKEPDFFDGWLYVGVLKKGVGDYEGAREVFLYASQIRPNSSTPLANLADLYAYFLDEPQKAEQAIKQAIIKDPNDYNFYLTLADIYRYKFTDGAAKYEKTMAEALAKFPNNVNLIAPLAGYFRDTNQTSKAIEWYKKLVKLSPDNAAAKEDLAELEKIKN